MASSSTVPYASKDSPLDGEFDVDLEKTKDVGTAEVLEAPSDNVPRKGPLWAAIKKFESWGVESRGIERVLPHERGSITPLNCFTMWAAANCTVSTFALGILGNSIWYLGFKDSFLTILFFNLLAAIPVGICSVWGMRTGMRQLALSRFGFGYYTVAIPTILNCLACIGWSCINSIAGGLVLVSVTHGSSAKPIPVQAAIAIIALATLVISFLGYKFVHAYEKYSPIPVVIIFIIYAVQVGKYADGGSYGGSGELEASSVLSFGAAIVGFGLGWVSLAADYSCGLPEDSNAIKVFAYTYAGVVIPCVLLETLGAAAVTMVKAREDIAAAYESEHVGGLLGVPLINAYGGFGRFAMVVLALSIIANNIPNVYSFSLTFQVLGKYAQAIPRPFLAIFCSLLYGALAIAGANSFESALDNLLLFLAYWLAMYTAILFIEHFYFRGGKWANWNFDALGVAALLPPGYAALAAIAVGWVGAVLGMSTVFFVGPIAKLVGDPKFGTDLGFLLSGSFAAVTYFPTRYLEKKKFGR